MMIRNIYILIIVCFFFSNGMLGQKIEVDSLRVKKFEERVQKFLTPIDNEKKIIKVTKGHPLYVDPERLRYLLKLNKTATNDRRDVKQKARPLTEPELERIRKKLQGL